MSNERYDLEMKTGDVPERVRAKLLYVSTAKYGGDWHSLPHTHPCTELFYVVGGMGQFRIAELLRRVSADDLVVINPHVEHTEVSFDASPMEYIVLGVEGLAFPPDEEGDGRYSVISLSGVREDILPYMRSMLREMEHKAEGYEVVCQDLLEVLVVRLMRRSALAVDPDPRVRRSSKECASVRRYIDSHFKENISLDLLAELAHVNKYYLVHTFTRECGISPISYLISRRIQESRRLLADTDHSLSQIAHMLGFSSPSYFSQSFRKLEGVSPMEYRRRRAAAEQEQGETILQEKAEQLCK